MRRHCPPIVESSFLHSRMRMSAATPPRHAASMTLLREEAKKPTRKEPKRRKHQEKPEENTRTAGRGGTKVVWTTIVDYRTVSLSGEPGRQIRSRDGIRGQPFPGHQPSRSMAPSSRAQPMHERRHELAQLVAQDLSSSSSSSSLSSLLLAAYSSSAAASDASDAANYDARTLHIALLAAS